MTDDFEVPADLQAERWLLGSLLLAPSQIPLAAQTVVPGDFYRPSHARLFDLMLELHADGRITADASQTVMAEVKRRGLERPTWSDLLGLTAEAPGMNDTIIRENIGIVVRLSTARRMAAVGAAIHDRAMKATDEPLELIDAAGELLATVPPPVLGRTAGLTVMDEFIDVTDTTPTPWVIPGLLRRGWRAMIVGAEGVGKGVTLRQIAGAAAQGVHPFRLNRIEPVRTLLVDAENPPDAVVETARPIRDQARLAAGVDYDGDRAYIWHRIGGMNLRDRRDRLTFEQVLAETRPDVVCAGPMYKLYRVAARERSDEQGTADVQTILDDLRTRFDFALVLEHHAPKTQGGGVRDMLPYGSSLWLRWPELGLSLIGKHAKSPKDMPDTSLTVGRWRRDRVKCSWPDRLDRGTAWPWVGWWKDAGTEDGQEEMI